MRFLNVTTQIANDQTEIVRVMNIISLNQKRVMNKLDLKYMSPEEVHMDNNWDDH